MTLWTDEFSSTVWTRRVLARSERHQGDCSKQLGLRRWTHACRAPDGCAGWTECREQLTGVKNANRLKRRERKVLWCKMVQSRKVPCTPLSTTGTKSAPIRAASGGCLWAVASHDLADCSCRWLWLHSSWRVAVYPSAAGHIQPTKSCSSRFLQLWNCWLEWWLHSWVRACRQLLIRFSQP